MKDTQCCDIKIILISLVTTNISDIMITGLYEPATFAYEQPYFITVSFTVIPFDIIDIFKFALVIGIGEVGLLFLYFLFLKFQLLLEFLVYFLSYFKKSFEVPLIVRNHHLLFILIMINLLLLFFIFAASFRFTSTILNEPILSINFSKCIEIL